MNTIYVLIICMGVCVCQLPSYIQGSSCIGTKGDHGTLQFLYKPLLSPVGIMCVSNRNYIIVNNNIILRWGYGREKTRDNPNLLVADVHSGWSQKVMPLKQQHLPKLSNSRDVMPLNHVCKLKPEGIREGRLRDPDIISLLITVLPLISKSRA